MKPAKFKYHAPKTIDEAIALLALYKGDARPLAGGQTLLPMMNFRIVSPVALVDLNQIKELSGIRQHNGFVYIGATTRYRELEFSPIIASTLPLMRESLGLISHLPIRTRGTIGGSLANSDPAAEMPMLLRLLDGKVVARGSGGERLIEGADFFVDLMTTALSPDELITEIRFPIMPAGAGYAIEEFSRRHGDFALAAIAALIVINGREVTARVAATGVGSYPVRLTAVEEHLASSGLGEESIEQATLLASEQVEPISDRYATAAYRRRLIHVLSDRALRRAAASASGTTSHG